MQKEYIANTSAKNSYGFSVDTNGIDLSRFEKNPIALYNHHQILGKWGKVEKRDGKLIVGDLKISRRKEAAELGMDIEDGILSSVSMAYFI